MKKIGMIGGLSPESTAEYYLQISRMTNNYLEGHHCAEIFIISIDPDEIIKAVHNNDWSRATEILIQSAKHLEKMGADFIMLPCNSLHQIADDIQKEISIPLLNIIDCVGDYMRKNLYSKVALLGTKFTMENAAYRDRLCSNYDTEIVTPSKIHRDNLHDIIFSELCHGNFTESSRSFLKNLCLSMAINMKCQAIILACTELPLLITQKNVPIKLINTTELHSEYAVDFATFKYPYKMINNHFMVA